MTRGASHTLRVPAGWTWARERDRTAIQRPIDALERDWSAIQRPIDALERDRSAIQRPIDALGSVDLPRTHTC